jgi:hypothetical protein
MSNKCDCYHTETKIVFWAPDEAPIGITTSSCWGTKEREECSCDGDKTRCNFYPEVREKAKKTVYIQDAINHFQYGISHDIFSEPVTSYAKMAVEALEKELKE